MLSKKNSSYTLHELKRLEEDKAEHSRLMATAYRLGAMLQPNDNDQNVEKHEEIAKELLRLAGTSAMQRCYLCAVIEEIDPTLAIWAVLPHSFQKTFEMWAHSTEDRDVALLDVVQIRFESVPAKLAEIWLKNTPDLSTAITIIVNDIENEEPETWLRRIKQLLLHGVTPDLLTKHYSHYAAAFASLLNKLTIDYRSRDIELQKFRQKQANQQLMASQEKDTAYVIKSLELQLRLIDQAKQEVEQAGRELATNVISHRRNEHNRKPNPRL